MVNKIISPGAEKTRGDACDVREMSCRRINFVIQTKSFSVKLELHTKILSGAKNYPDFQEFFVSQNKAKNAGRSLKNAGMREIG